MDGIGPVLAETISAWVSNPNNRDLLARLRDAGVDPVDDTPAPPADHPFAGKTLVVTGRLETMSRAEAQAAIKSNGGKASSSVSRKTDYLVAGADAGSKHATAVRLGVPVLDEEQFVRVLKGEVAGTGRGRNRPIEDDAANRPARRTWGCDVQVAAGPVISTQGRTLGRWSSKTPGS